MKNLAFYSLALGLLLGACGAGLPEERPPDFEFRYSRDGGMRPNYLTFDIRGGKGDLHQRMGRKDFRMRFTVTAAEQDRLYAILRKFRAHTIESENRGKVYDRGGPTVAFKADGRRWRVSGAGNMFIVKGDRARWNGLLAAVRGFIADMRARYGKNGTETEK
jgi:hypothetical protein